MVLRENFPDVSKLNMIIYKFITSHINFTKNEHVKLDETQLDAQGQFEAYLSNALDVLGRLTSKVNENLNTAYLFYINSCKIKNHEHT